MSDAVAEVGTAREPRTGTRFMFRLAAIQLGVVFLGFAPTFYLDPLFDTVADRHPMPFYLIVVSGALTTLLAIPRLAKGAAVATTITMARSGVAARYVNWLQAAFFG